jgi:hypothetical protein
MRQLIGTTANWAANDLVIGDGELALERTVTGVTLTKIGDGIKRFSQLSYVDFDLPKLERPLLPPTVRKFLSGSGTYTLGYTFVITAGNATAGATYTHNGVTYTVLNTIAGATQIILTGSAAPLTTGTLTKASGTGDATLTFSQALAPLYLRYRMAGGGGGGGGGALKSANNGGTGGTGVSSTFAGATAGGGVGGFQLNAAGGTATLGAGHAGLALSGGSSTGLSESGANLGTAGGTGGGNALGGAGGGGAGGTGTAGMPGAPNTGAGGGGGGGNGGSGAGSLDGAGGGAGGFIDAIIANPASTYAYAVGAGGNGGTAGTTGFAGGAGGSGVLVVEECYQ